MWLVALTISYFGLHMDDQTVRVAVDLHEYSSVDSMSVGKRSIVWLHMT